MYYWGRGQINIGSLPYWSWTFLQLTYYWLHDWLLLLAHQSQGYQILVLHLQCLPAVQLSATMRPSPTLTAIWANAYDGDGFPWTNYTCMLTNWHQVYSDLDRLLFMIHLGSSSPAGGCLHSHPCTQDTYRTGVWMAIQCFQWQWLALHE